MFQLRLVVQFIFNHPYRIVHGHLCLFEVRVYAQFHIVKQRQGIVYRGLYALFLHHHIEDGEQYRKHDDSAYNCEYVRASTSPGPTSWPSRTWISAHPWKPMATGSSVPGILTSLPSASSRRTSGRTTLVEPRRLGSIPTSV